MSNVSLKELVEFLARALVDNPDDVEVSVGNWIECSRIKANAHVCPALQAL